MEKIVSSSSVDTVGLMTPVCDVNKELRYTLQVIAVVLMKTLKDTHWPVYRNCSEQLARTKHGAACS